MNESNNSETSAANCSSTFVGGSTVKPDCSRHKKEVAGIADMKQLAEMVGDLHYESLTEFLCALAEKISMDGHKDEANYREKLAEQLYNVAGYLAKASIHSGWAWEICKPFMK